MVVASNSLPHEDMRIICDAECSSRCKNSHPGGNGFCVNDKVCRCYYNMNIETDHKVCEQDPPPSELHTNIYTHTVLTSLLYIIN